MSAFVIKIKYIIIESYFNVIRQFLFCRKMFEIDFCHFIGIHLMYQLLILLKALIMGIGIGTDLHQSIRTAYGYQGIGRTFVLRVQKYM